MSLMTWWRNWLAPAVTEKKVLDDEDELMVESLASRKERVERIVQSRRNVHDCPVPAPGRPNWRKLQNGCYLVRTQAGFMQVLRDSHPDLSRREIRNGVTKWPTKYPSIVRVGKWSCSCILINCAPIDEYRTKTQALLDDLAGE